LVVVHPTRGADAYGLDLIPLTQLLDRPDDRILNGLRAM
jgi:hypothetical protein